LDDLGYEILIKPGKGGNIYKNNMLVANSIRDGMLFQLKTIQRTVRAYAAVIESIEV
jgi:hypothetical protein